MSKDILFLGGFCGTSKKNDKDFYCLNFAKQSDMDNHFGYDICQCFVEEKEYKEFQVKAKPNTFVTANIKYIRGGWSLTFYML